MMEPFFFFYFSVVWLDLLTASLFINVLGCYQFLAFVWQTTLEFIRGESDSSSSSSPSSVNSTPSKRFIQRNTDEEEDEENEKERSEPQSDLPLEDSRIVQFSMKPQRGGKLEGFVILEGCDVVEAKVDVEFSKGRKIPPFKTSVQKGSSKVPLAELHCIRHFLEDALSVFRALSSEDGNAILIPRDVESGGEVCC